ncbi:MAG: hypothetical protein ABIJ56_06055 [Pseudomonadota bacterium]
MHKPFQAVSVTSATHTFTDRQFLVEAGTITCLLLIADPEQAKVTRIISQESREKCNMRGLTPSMFAGIMVQNKAW